MELAELIKTKYGSSCRLCPPLDTSCYEEAGALLPEKLFGLLKCCDGIEELMSLPDIDGGEPFAVGYIVYRYEEIKTQTAQFKEFFPDEEGTVFSGNGAGGYYVLAPDGRVRLYEYVGEDGEDFAKDLEGFFG